jgi:hypothetical protein
MVVRCFAIYGSAMVVGGLAILASTDSINRWTRTVGLVLLTITMVAERVYRHRARER